MKIAVSILKSKYDEKETIDKINETNADYIHVDVMDGKFTPNKSSEYEHLNESSKPLSVHLMVVNPFSYISKYSLKNTDIIIFQREIDEDILGLIDFIHSLNKRAGIAINPETSITMLEDYLDKIDEVLILTVKPGMGGQEMIDGVNTKIDELVIRRNERNYNYKISVDGGVNDKTIAKVKTADTVISGSYICLSDIYQEKIDLLKTINRI